MPTLSALIISLFTLSAGHATASEDLDQRLANDSSFVLGRNAEGDTPLGEALKSGDRARAERLLRAMSPKELRHRNAAGESYVALAARAGLADVVATLGQMYYQVLGPLNRYDFAKLDRPDQTGRRALFKAANRAVAENLEAQHYRGILKWPWWDFMMARDKGGQNFLHAAAADDRADLIFWGTERLCDEGRWQRSKRWYKRYPAWVEQNALNVAQTYVIGDVRLPFDRIINHRDHEGMTPLHVAVATGRWAALRALNHCRWLDFDLTDKHGDLPIHTFLRHLDPRVAEHPAATREAFDFLLAQNTHLRLNTLASRLRVKNLDGDTPLHQAATLADPYFYSHLARVGDAYVTNHARQTAEQIFSERRRQLALP